MEIYKVSAFHRVLAEGFVVFLCMILLPVYWNFFTSIFAFCFQICSIFNFSNIINQYYDSRNSKWRPLAVLGFHLL